VGELKGLSGMLDVFPQKNECIVATLMLGWSGLGWLEFLEKSHIMEE